MKSLYALYQTISRVVEPSLPNRGFGAADVVFARNDSNAIIAVNAIICLHRHRRAIHRRFFPSGYQRACRRAACGQAHQGQEKSGDPHNFRLMSGTPWSESGRPGASAAARRHSGCSLCELIAVSPFKKSFKFI